MNRETKPNFFLALVKSIFFPKRNWNYFQNRPYTHEEEVINCLWKHGTLSESQICVETLLDYEEIEQIIKKLVAENKVKARPEIYGREIYPRGYMPYSLHFEI
jgi:hypothetical protein